MTKAELIAAIASAPDDAEVYVDSGGIWRSNVSVFYDAGEIVITFAAPQEGTNNV